MKRQHLEQVHEANLEALSEALERKKIGTAQARTWLVRQLVRLYHDDNTGGREKLGALKRLDEKLAEQPLGWEHNRQGEGGERVTVNAISANFSEEDQRQLLERIGRTIVDEVSGRDQEGS